MTRTRLLAALAAPTALLFSMTAWTPLPTASAVGIQPDTSIRNSFPAHRLVVAPAGNEARYRIQERLVGMDLPYDAVGETEGVRGQIVLDGEGRVIPSESRILIDVRQLTSDKDRRDRFVQTSLLETGQHPVVQLVPTEIRGLPRQLPTAGTGTFQLVGNLTIRGVARSTVWKVSARYEGDRIVGKAVTAFTFDDFDLKQPRVPVVLTLADVIQLEYDFVLDRETASTY